MILFIGQSKLMRMNTHSHEGWEVQGFTAMPVLRPLEQEGKTTIYDVQEPACGSGSICSKILWESEDKFSFLASNCISIS